MPIGVCFDKRPVLFAKWPKLITRCDSVSWSDLMKCKYINFSEQNHTHAHTRKNSARVWLYAIKKQIKFNEGYVFTRQSRTEQQKKS